MGIFICLGAVIVLSIIFAWISEYFDWYTINITSWIIGILSAIVICIILLFLPTLQSVFDYTKEKYYNLKAQVEYVESDIILNDSNLRNQVLEMNNKISSHKVYSKNWFIGMFYSEEIGNLPRLQWKNELNLNN